jgi:hypothetical protein
MRRISDAVRDECNAMVAIPPTPVQVSRATA